ncbi:kunitz/Bovine pancreatic trypsin inhibitor domain-containing protein [Phthorimaea operculella]|nr:kunitz/Bovine pancreatic trypsin inhibitor domain-containing protein [Phthorimaea operculella]
MAYKPEGRPRYCFLTFDYGWCFGADERYYYDRTWGVCKKTIYSGCGGNKNNFYSKEKCDDICRFGTDTLSRQKTTKGDGLKKILIVNPNDKAKKTPDLSTPPPMAPDGPVATGDGPVPTSAGGGQ